MKTVNNKYHPSPGLISWPRLAIRNYHPHIYQITPLGSDGEFYWGENTRGPIKGARRDYMRFQRRGSLALAFLFDNGKRNLNYLNQYHRQRGIVGRWVKDQYGWEVFRFYGLNLSR